MNASAGLLVAAILATTAILWRRVGFNLSLSSVLFGLMILFHGPAYLYYTRVYGPETKFFETILVGLDEAEVLGSLDIALSLAFIFLGIGVFCADYVTNVTMHRWRRSVSAWSHAKVEVEASQARRIMTLCALLTVVLLLPFVIIDSQIPKVLNYFMSDLGEFEKIALRREGGGSSFYLYNLLLSNLIPFVAFCVLGLLFVKARISISQALVFIALIALAKAATLSKAPLAIFSLQCAVVWLMLHSLKPSAKAALTLLALATSLFLLMSWVANPGVDELAEMLEFLFYRVFMIVNESLIEYFAAIPYAIDHSWGTQFSWVATLFQAEPQLPTYWLVGGVHRGEIGSTTTVMFVGDAWADFSWAGVVVSALFAGFIVRWIDIHLIVKRGKTVISTAGLGLGHFGVFVALSTSLQTALITGGLLFVIPFVNLLSSLSIWTVPSRHDTTTAPSGQDVG